MESNGGQWHDGIWKGEFASRHRISQEAIEEMNNTIIDNINEHVADDDTLWHLGDFAFAPKQKYVQQCAGYRNRIRCQNVNIIWGNHDEPQLIRHLFNQNHTLTKISVPGQKEKAILCHYAMAVWDGSHRGNWQLYGHSHTTAESGMDAHFPDRKSIDVGVDNAFRILGEFRPFSLDELQRMLNKRLGHVLDHHTPRNLKAKSENHLM